MELKAKNFTIDKKFSLPLVTEDLPDPCFYGGYTTHLPGYNLIIGAKYPVVELTGHRDGINLRETVLLIDAEVVEKDKIISRNIEIVEAPKPP